MAAKTFSAQVEDWVKKSKARMLAVLKESAEDVVELMTEPGPSVMTTKRAIAKGLCTRGRGAKRGPVQGPVKMSFGSGNMPVDTGYLRASVRAAIGAPLPIDPQSRPRPGQPYAYDPGPINLVIEGWDGGRPLYVTFTAAYAAAVEYGTSSTPPRRFVALAVQQWPQIVAKNFAALRTRIDQNGGTP